MLVGIEGLADVPKKKEILEPNARIYAYAKDEAEAGTSKVVTVQLTIANKCANMLFDFGATHSFASTVFAECVDRSKDKIVKCLGWPYRLVKL